MREQSLLNINRIKINGITNPIGYKLDQLILSYTGSYNINQTHMLKLVIFSDENLTELLYEQLLDIAESHCTVIGFVPQKETRYYFILQSGENKSSVCYFETGTDFDCSFITPMSNITHPVLFRQFLLPQSIVSARLYVTGVGLYEACINGKKVGNEYLTPYCDDYDNALQYQTYDVTDYIGTDNKIEIYLGDGWYKGRFGLKHRTDIYGSAYAVAAKLVVKDRDGNKIVLTTDESWMARRSNVISSGIYDGEIVDDTINTDESFGVKIYEKRFNVIPRISLPIICKREIKPELIISSKGENILDFKQNMSGIIRIMSRLKRGETVRLTFGEVLQEGCFYRENLRTARAEYVYTGDGTEKTIKPRFTYYGFRYVLVEGIDKVNPEDFTAEVIYSDIEETVKISTDNEKINRLLENCKWGQYSNFVDIPTDCPQRDERLGWTGDAQVFSKTACFQTDSKAFYDKYLYDMRNDQKLLAGKIPMYSPSMKESSTACSVWSDVATVIPWNLYQFYGDKSLLKKHFPLITDYVNTLIAADDANGGNRLYNFGFHLGDWLSQDGESENALKSATDDYFIASMYYNSVRIAAETSKVLGETELYRHYANVCQEIWNSLIREYFTSSGRLAIDTQTAYALCVGFDVCVDKEKLKIGFQERLKKDGYKVKGGFVGATQLVQSAIGCGLIEDAFRILYSERFPSWLYCVNLGATTIWERWNSLNEDGTVSGTGMNSLNHYSYGAVAEAFYSYIAGLKPLTPGFKQVEILPVFNYRLKKLEFTYSSASGEYMINYRIDKANTVSLHISIPFGAEAMLRIPQSPDFGVKKIECGVYDFEFVLKDNMDYPFSTDTPICELLANPITADALKKISPGLFYFFSKTETGLEGESLSYVARQDSFRIPEDKLMTLDNELRNIKG